MQVRPDRTNFVRTPSTSSSRAFHPFRLFLTSPQHVLPYHHHHVRSTHPSPHPHAIHSSVAQHAQHSQHQHQSARPSDRPFARRSPGFSRTSLGSTNSPNSSTTSLSLVRRLVTPVTPPLTASSARTASRGSRGTLPLARCTTYIPTLPSSSPSCSNHQAASLLSPNSKQEARG